MITILQKTFKPSLGHTERNRKILLCMNLHTNIYILCVCAAGEYWRCVCVVCVWWEREREREREREKRRERERERER